jgi:pimeloyl-ACP methyl ester carboxylesterase
MIKRINGVDLHYEVLGKGSPLFIVHGWGGSSKSLLALGELLSKSHTVVLVDLPGFGESQLPPADWGVQEYALCVKGLIDSFKYKKVDYFGHSFGGSLGIYLAAHTTLISRLVLCDSSYKRNPKKSKLAMAIKQIVPQNPHLRMLFYRIFFRNSDLARYPRLEPNFRLIVGQDLSGMVADIEAPTLILWGELDRVTPVELAHELEKNIRNSRLVVVGGARHGLPLRQPEIVAEHVEAFLKQ